MKRMVSAILGVVAVAVVLLLFLLPVVSISVQFTRGTANSSVDLFQTSVSASIMYAYFGVGAVQVPNSVVNAYGMHYSYCLMYGNPGTMRGVSAQRVMMGG